MALGALGQLGRAIVRVTPRIVPAITRGGRAVAGGTTVQKAAATAVAADLVALPVASELTDGAVPAPRLIKSAVEEAAESVGGIFAATQLGLVEGVADAFVEDVDQATGGNGLLVLGGIGALVLVLFLAMRR